MSENISNKKITTETEIGSNGVGHSNMHGSADDVMASSAELTKALEASQQTVAALTKKLEEATAQPKSDTSLDKLAEAIIKLSNPGKATGPTDPDNLNTTKDYSQKTIVDGNSLIEAQASLMYYKNEPKVPVSVPKAFADQFGPSLPVSVNGVRVSIPCDGKTYYINQTHAEAIKERIAKVDRLLADKEPQILETLA